jgi:hypothetical protein
MIIETPLSISELIALYHGNNKMQTQRIANLFLQLLKHEPEQLQPHFADLLNGLTIPNQTDAVKRNTTRLFRELKTYPEDLLGQLTSICFDLAASPIEAIAVRAFSMHILNRISKIEPDILPELRLIAEDAMRHSSPGIRNVAGKMGR